MPAITVWHAYGKSLSNPALLHLTEEQCETRRRNQSKNPKKLVKKKHQWKKIPERHKEGKLRKNDQFCDWNWNNKQFVNFYDLEIYLAEMNSSFQMRIKELMN